MAPALTAPVNTSFISPCKSTGGMFLKCDTLLMPLGDCDWVHIPDHASGSKWRCRYCGRVCYF